MEINKHYPQQLMSTTASAQFFYELGEVLMLILIVSEK